LHNIKVVTYNIQHGRNLAGILDLGQCARELADLAPDIIALQEVDCCRWNTRLNNQARRLAKRLGMYHVYGPVRSYRPGSYGNAILSSFPIVACSNHVMTPEGDHRCCLEADIYIEGTTVKVMAIHLGLKSAERVIQVQDTIIPLVKGLGTACIVAGDFNASPAFPEMELMRQYMSDSFAQNSGLEQNTFPSDHPHIRIDYIFTRNCQAEDCRIVAEATASDHLPVAARINLPDPSYTPSYKRY